jgi:hypothetical protein
MTNQHSITPPPELVREWCAHSNKYETYDQFWNHIATEAARWGADQELEACCAWLVKLQSLHYINALRTARRPKPPTLKEQALDELASAERLYPADWSTIRKALEALPND